MKKYFLLAILLIAAGCQKNVGTNKNSLQYPADWQISPLAPTSNKAFFVPNLLASFVSQYCAQKPTPCYEGSDLQIYYFSTVFDYTKQFIYSGGPNYKNLAELMQDKNAEVHAVGNTTVDGNPAYLVSVGGFGQNDGVVVQYKGGVYELDFPTVQNSVTYNGAKTNLINLVVSTWKFN